MKVFKYILVILFLSIFLINNITVSSYATAQKEEILESIANDILKVNNPNKLPKDLYNEWKEIKDNVELYRLSDENLEKVNKLRKQTDAFLEKVQKHILNGGETAITQQDKGRDKSEKNTVYMNEIIDSFEAKELKTSDTKNLRKIIGKFLKVLQNITALIIIIIMASTGFNYVVASTPDMKAEVKNKMLPVIVGSIFVFGAVSITQFIFGALE